jgi:hypothetical protein
VNIPNQRRARDVELLFGGVTLVIAGLVLVSVMPGPDPCLPVLCPSPPLGFGLPIGPGGMTGAQIATLVLFVVGGAVLIARAMTSRWWIIAVAATSAVLIAAFLFNAASPIGPWRTAEDSSIGFGQRPFVADITRGPSHCGQQRIAFLTMAWPPGSEIDRLRFPSSASREFAWSDRNDLTMMRPAVDSSLVDQLPADAVDTGLRRGSWELWTSPGLGDTAVFLKSGTYIQRWPQVRPTACL